ncbi:MAG: glycosyltransferase family 4 protein [Solirubrobacteraceae bacterium]
MCLTAIVLHWDNAAGMDIAIVAPSPVPLAIGGAENLWWGLLEHLNRDTAQHADLIKLPTPERDFWEIVDSYRRWSALDVSGYDVVISGKYPAWMVDHPRHVCYLLHPLRGLYDTYPAGWPERCETTHPEVSRLVDFLEASAGDRSDLVECFGRLDAVRARSDVPPELLALPGPLIRQIVHFLDRIGRGPGAMVRSVALSRTVADRPGYFSNPASVPVVHAPTGLRGLRPGRGRYLFTVSRLDAPKRIDLLVRAMAHVRGSTELRIAGTGPQESALRELASGDPRIHFEGFLNDSALSTAYASASAVVFVPFQEDYGFITLEAMLSAKPVITTSDSGGPTELVTPWINGLISEPDPAQLGAAIDSLVAKPRLARRMGREGRKRALDVTWDSVVTTLLDGIEL